MNTRLNRGDIVRAKTDFRKNDQIIVPRDSPGQIVGITEQEDARGKHPFSYQVHWFTDDSEVPITTSIKWLERCGDDCSCCKYRFLCFTNKLHLKPLSQDELDVIKANWEKANERHI